MSWLFIGALVGAVAALAVLVGMRSFLFGTVEVPVAGPVVASAPELGWKCPGCQTTNRPSGRTCYQCGVAR